MTLLRHMRCAGLAALLLGLGITVGARSDGTVPIFDGLTAVLDEMTQGAALGPNEGLAATKNLSLRESYVSPRWDDVVLDVPTRPPAA